MTMIKVLKYLADTRDALTVEQIAEEMGLNKSEVAHALKSLLKREYVERWKYDTMLPGRPHYMCPSLTLSVADLGRK